MLKRTVTLVIGIAVLIPVCVFSGTFVLPVVFALLSCMGVFEMLGCVGLRRELYIAFPLYAFALAVPFGARYLDSEVFFFWTIAVLFALLIYMYTCCVFRKGKLDITLVSTAYAASIYVIAGLNCIILLRFVDKGEYIYLIPVLAPWISDIFAYICGRLFGRHKLIPEISPKKTVEGSIGGIVFCSLLCMLYGYILKNRIGITNIPEYYLFAIGGVIISVISQIGDLIASVMKRHFGIKDYGFIFPGHGGVVDRFDSVIATAPLFLMLYSLVLRYNLTI